MIMGLLDSQSSMALNTLAFKDTSKSVLERKINLTY